MATRLDNLGYSIAAQELRDAYDVDYDWPTSMTTPN